MDVGTVTAFAWPDAVAVLGIVLGATVLIGGAMAAFVALRKTRVAAAQQDDLRQLVRRYEHFAENALDAQQRLAADGAMFSAWLEARAAKDTQLQAILVRRFSPEYRVAFTAWLATEPFTNPDAPPGPGYLPEYHNPGMEQAEKLNEHAAALEEAGTEARHTAEEYVRATVLFALVLFLVAVGQRFRVSCPRVVATHQRFFCHSLAFPRTASGVRPRVQRPVWARSVL